MIVKLKLDNFYSIGQEEIIDFTASYEGGPLSHSDPNLISYGEDKFVKIVGLYGSNASGKSNVVKALAFCRNLILNSHLYNQGSRFDYVPFKFGDKRPSSFLIDFIDEEGMEYEYSFELFDNRIVSERLYYFPKKRRAKIFERSNGNCYSYGKGVVNRPKEVEANTGDTTLFLSRASSMNRNFAIAVYDFFLNDMLIGIDSFRLDDDSIELIQQYKDMLLATFKMSDIDISDFQLIRSEAGRPRIITFHNENPDLAFDFEMEESEGTRRLFFIILAILKSSGHNIAIFLDEFDLKLHILLSEFILDIVRASNRMQLLFTSHNVELLNTNLMRTEQIVFVNKGSGGSTTLIPLIDFTDFKRGMDLKKAYMQGRFDAIPYISTSQISKLLGES